MTNGDRARKMCGDAFSKVSDESIWWSTPLPYRVLGPGGEVLMQGAERVRDNRRHRR